MKIVPRLLYPFVCLLLTLIVSGADGQIQSAELETSNFKPYIHFGFTNDSPVDHNYGAFHYTNANFIDAISWIMATRSFDVPMY